MSLIPLPQFKQLLKNTDTANTGKDHIPAVKLFMPATHCKWLISEFHPESIDVAFGLIDEGIGNPVFGYIYLQHLPIMRNKFGHKIRFDSYFEPRHQLSVYGYAAEYHNQITEIHNILDHFV